MSNTFLDRLMVKPDVNELEHYGHDRRQEALQRMQIGLAGLAVIILLIVLTETILRQTAQNTAKVVVAEATAPKNDKTAPQIDPLAEAGLVPDLPAEERRGKDAEPSNKLNAKAVGGADRRDSDRRSSDNRPNAGQ